MNDAPLSDLLIQSIIKIENHLMAFSDSGWQDYPDTGRSTGAYIIFYQGVLSESLLSELLIRLFYSIYGYNILLWAYAV